jgi:hypothetical protein
MSTFHAFKIIGDFLAEKRKKAAKSHFRPFDNGSYQRNGVTEMLILHPSNKHEVARSDDQTALAEAARTARALRGIGADCSARAMLILAAQRFPDDDLAMAAKKLTAEFEVFRAQIKPIAAQVEAERKAENERLSPWNIAAMGRLGELSGRIGYLDRCIEALRRRNGTPDGDAGELRRQGVSAAEIERIHGKQPTEAEMVAKRDALKAAHEKIDLFLKTGDLSLLPADLKPHKRLEIGTGHGSNWTASGASQGAA